MSERALREFPPRPQRVAEETPPPIPAVDPAKLNDPSTQLSQHRTQLSTHRTGLSEHRTQLSEHRTDLSTHRTDLSTARTEMSMRRTGMSFQRTRMSAERTLMSVIRTALSLISFGFTIFQFFHKMADQNVLSSSAPARNFGITLVMLGIAMLVIGIVYHLMYMKGLREQRNAMTTDGLIHGQSGFPPSMTLVTALLLLALGVVAVISMVFRIGPLG